MGQFVLIPTSRLVANEMQFEVGQVPPTALRISGRPLLEYIIESYVEEFPDTQFILAVDEGREHVEKIAARSQYAEHILCVPVNGKGSLGATILDALSKMNLSENDTLIIHFGDTYAQFDRTQDQSVVYFHDLPESYRWTSCLIHEGEVTAFIEKLTKDSMGKHHAVVGVFSLHKPASFFHCLHAKVGESVTSLDPFYSALLLYGQTFPLQAKATLTWDDFGHLDNYYQARQRHLNARFFNELRVSPTRGTIRKTSANTDKFRDEIQWYQQLPGDLQPFIPRVFQYDLEGKQPFVEMEYYGYPNLGELYLWGEHDLGMWSYAIDAIFLFIHEMGKYQLIEDGARISDYQHEIYFHKTLKRYDAIRQDAFLSPFLEEDLLINGHTCRSLQSIVDNLEPLLSEAGIYSREHYSVIHGDLCLSNILYDPKNRIIKVIDPRGSFGSQGIAGDAHYDLSKLSHSFRGRYESIVNDEFTILCEERNIQFEIDGSSRQNDISQIFSDKLNAYSPSSLQHIDLIEPLLYLSMVPLHADHPHRQLAMLCTASMGFERYAARWKGVYSEKYSAQISSSIT
jgi:hypothetical protein